MTRLKQKYESKGFFGIGILYNANPLNVGTLWRSAYILGASFIFTVDRKYQQQPSDTAKAWSQIPLFHYNTFEDLKANLPYSTQLIGVELVEESVPLAAFEHPKRAVYLLGNEKIGLPESVLKACHSVVRLPGNFSLNVAVTGSILMYDRASKLNPDLPHRIAVDESRLVIPPEI
jgi:tRNA G18 (ribose-2'-O)-methylase SpoU